MRNRTLYTWRRLCRGPGSPSLCGPGPGPAGPTAPHPSSSYTTYTVRKEIKCSGDSEILVHEIVRDNTQTQISLCFSNFRVLSRTIWCSISESTLHLISFLTIMEQMYNNISNKRKTCTFNSWKSWLWQLERLIEKL